MAAGFGLDRYEQPFLDNHIAPAVPAMVRRGDRAVGRHVAKYLGDGVLAYFGWPAHEDDAEAAGARRDRTHRGGGQTIDATARIGMATGLVRVGEIVAGKVQRWSRP